MSVWFIVISGAGAYGLFSVINLTAHLIDNEHRLPKTAWVLGGVLTGIAVCISIMVSMHFEPFAIIVFGAPSLGGIHLVWLYCREIQHAT